MNIVRIPGPLTIPFASCCSCSIKEITSKIWARVHRHDSPRRLFLPKIPPARGPGLQCPGRRSFCPASDDTGPPACQQAGITKLVSDGVVAPRSRVDGCWRPVPGQEVVETVYGMAVDHGLEHVVEVGVGLDVVELRRGDAGADRAPSLCAAIATGEEMGLAPQRHGPDGALDGVVVELDAAVVEEAGECRPACERMADGFASPPRFGMRPSWASSQGFMASTRGRDIACRARWRASAGWPRMRFSTA